MTSYPKPLASWPLDTWFPWDPNKYTSGRTLRMVLWPIFLYLWHIHRCYNFWQCINGLKDSKWNKSSTLLWSMFSCSPDLPVACSWSFVPSVFTSTSPTKMETHLSPSTDASTFCFPPLDHRQVNTIFWLTPQGLHSKLCAADTLWQCLWIENSPLPIWSKYQEKAPRNHNARITAAEQGDRKSGRCGTATHSEGVLHPQLHCIMCGK